ncbi:MAG: NAD-dependent epimerase/dehydratase family protein [Gemmatimonadetes bacterium]|nr:NAD-dependent epimerase/dehydratase family protein [Gemmatimonadota bacterium]NNK63243.1 NAD-dependent epimerase/dehydratase family protein [Gemmatimonadota bacterium]
MNHDPQWDGRRVVVTGAAGFIGSRVAAGLAAAGADVVGVDCFDPYYAEAQKRANVARIRGRFRLLETDLAEVDLEPLLDGVSCVFHLSAQAGVRGSWASGFDHYVRANIQVTQRLLETVRGSSLERFVYSSSSSVYGDVSGPVDEDAPTRPRSPYGVTKLSAEHLCGVYAREFDVPTVSLRYFTVFGPGQRPDMAIHRMIESALHDRPFPLYGDGSARRDFTFVADVVSANLLAAVADVEPGTVLNVGGGSTRSVSSVLDDVAEAVGRPVPIDRQARQPGDVAMTAAICDRAGDLLGWAPRVPWREALARQVAWHREGLGRV